MYSLLLLALGASIQPTIPQTPLRQPQLAVDRDRVVMTFGAGSSLYFASSNDMGLSFGKPVRVAENGALALGRHRGPRVTILKDALLVSAIVGGKAAIGAHAHGLPESGNLRVWRSTDKGVTWKSAGVVNDIPGAAREGLHAIAVSPDGSLTAVWLDLRTPGMKLYGSRSLDGGVTSSKNTVVYASPSGEICSCCHPSLTVEAGGRVWVMFAAPGAEVRQLAPNGSFVNLAPLTDGSVLAAWEANGGIETKRLQ